MTTSAYDVETFTTNDSWRMSTVPEDSTGLASLLACSWYKFIVDFCMIGIIALLGLFGNILSCIIFWGTVHANTTSLILFVLAISDTGVLLIYITTKVIPTVLTFSGADDHYRRYVSPYKSGYIWAVGSICHMLGSWAILLVTIHRYVAVCHPHRAKIFSNIKWARLQVTALIICSIIFYIPRFVNTSVNWKGDRLMIVRHDQSYSYTVGYKVIVYYLVQYVIPFSCLLFLTSRLLFALRKARLRREQMTRSKRDEEDITRTLVAVVIIFLICQLLNPIRRALSAAYPSSARGCGSFYFYYNGISSLGVVVNSAVNVLIYYYFGQRFRRNVRSKILFRAHVAAVESTTYPRTVQENTT